MLQRLKELRGERGLSQAALGELLHASQQSIFKYEAGLTEPDIAMLVSMAEFFDVSIDYLLGYSDTRHKVEEVTRMDLNAEELSLVESFRQLPASTRKALLALVHEFH